MTTLLLIVAAVVVFGLIVGCVCLMCEDAGTWFLFMVTGVPQMLLRLLGAVVVAIFEHKNE